MKDDNDRAREGTLPSDPEEGTEEMPRPAEVRTPEQILGPMWKTLGELEAGFFDSPPPEPRWLLTRGERGTGAVRMGKVGLVVAAGGIGKTQALVLLALAVATGGWWLGSFHAATPGRVLLALGEEDLEEVKRRMYATAWMLGLSAEEKRLAADRIVVLPLCGIPVALVARPEKFAEAEETAFLAAMRAKLAEHADWSLIALDPLSRWAGADTETDNASATRFIEAAETLAAPAYGAPAVIIAHHTPKATRNNNGPITPRGASALYDGARWVSTLEEKTFAERDDADPMPFELVEFAVIKSNLSPRGEPVLLLKDKRHNGALRPLHPSEREELELWRQANTKRKPEKDPGRGKGADSRPTEKDPGRGV